MPTASYLIFKAKCKPRYSNNQLSVSLLLLKRLILNPLNFQVLHYENIKHTRKSCGRSHFLSLSVSFLGCHLLSPRLVFPAQGSWLEKLDLVWMHLSCNFHRLAVHVASHQQVPNAICPPRVMCNQATRADGNDPSLPLSSSSAVHLGRLQSEQSFPQRLQQAVFKKSLPFHIYQIPAIK